MNQHLSSQQISQYLVGDLTPEQEVHAHECPLCGARLARLESSLSHFRSSVRNLKETQMMTKMYSGNETMAGFTSLLIHGGVVAMLLLLGTLKPVQRMVHESVSLIAPNLKPYEAARSAGGGGGGRSPIEASKGKLPKSAPRVFTPPRVDPADSKLPMVPTIIGDVPNIAATNYGDPLGKMGTPSNGTGFGGGIGSGDGGGVGSGSGVGYRGGFGGGVYRIGGGVSSPSIIHKVEPEYSEEARKAKWQGTVQLSVIVDENGHPRDIKVAQSLGLGLDQKAIEAVGKWLFKPAMKDGKPVAVLATIQVTFHLL
jgi:periplasmic protein TonB